MGKKHVISIALLTLAVAAGWFITQRLLEPERPGPGLEDRDAAADERTGVRGGPAAPAPERVAEAAGVVGDDVVYTEEDVRIFREAMAWAAENRLDTLELGDAIVELGRRFVGEPYIEQPLELPGEERLVVNLRGFDCVTFVESILAMARMVRAGRSDFGTFTEELRRIRYRDGNLDGYLSRLHYFSEWIADNEDAGLLRDVTASLGGRSVDEPIDFMSSNAELYPHLEGRADRIARMQEIERELSRRTRSYIPQSDIAAAVDGIRNGDIIAATSSVRGLDVAHTGFAIWREGRLHLMHAPLVGSVTEVSDQPLAVRIQRIDGQDGVIVARPL